MSDADKPCGACKQTTFVSGEYPCPECGRPTVHDAKAACDPDNLAERIAEAAFTPDCIELNQVDCLRTRQLPAIQERLAPLYAELERLQAENAKSEAAIAVALDLLRERDKELERLRSDLALLRRSDLLVIANAEKDATASAEA